MIVGPDSGVLQGGMGPGVSRVRERPRTRTCLRRSGACESILDQWTEHRQVAAVTVPARYWRWVRARSRRGRSVVPMRTRQYRSWPDDGDSTRTCVLPPCQQERYRFQVSVWPRPADGGVDRRRIRGRPRRRRLPIRHTRRSPCARSRSRRAVLIADHTSPRRPRYRGRRSKTNFRCIRRDRGPRAQNRPRTHAVGAGDNGIADFTAPTVEELGR